MLLRQRHQPAVPAAQVSELSYTPVKGTALTLQVLKNGRTQIGPIRDVQQIKQSRYSDLMRVRILVGRKMKQPIEQVFDSQ